MYRVYASVRRPDYRLVTRKSAPLPSWARTEAWRLLAERQDVGGRIREHCDRYGFYVSAEICALGPGRAVRLVTQLAEAARTVLRSRPGHGRGHEGARPT